VGPGDWEGLAADGRHFNGRYQQTIGPDRAERTPTRQLSAFAAECRAAAPLLLSVGTCCTAPAAHPQISCPQGAQQQTRSTPLLLSIDGTD